MRAKDRFIFTMRLPSDLAEMVDAEAQNLGITRTAFIILSLRKVLEE